MATTYDKASLVMIPSGYKDDKLYSVKPTDGSGDFTFSRDGAGASPATRVNASGLIEKGRENILTYSNTFNTNWSFANANVTGGQVGYDGSNDAWLLSKTAGFGRIQIGVSASGVHTASVYLKAGSLNWCRFLMLPVAAGTDPQVYINLADGSLGSEYNNITATSTSVGGGWYRLTLTFQQAITEFRIYPADGNNNVGGTSGNIYIQDAQLESGLVATDYIETTTAPVSAGLLGDMPRLDYSGGATCGSLLLEPSRVNLMANSEYFPTFFSGLSVTQNATTSPEGVTNATKAVELSGTNGKAINLDSVSYTSGTTYTHSFFAKSSNRYIQMYFSNSLFTTDHANFDLVNGVVGGKSNDVTSSIEDYGNGWYRCTATITAPATASVSNLLLLVDDVNATRGQAYTGDGSSFVEVYGMQVEAGSYPTSYIPTYGSASTRAADSCSKTGISSLIGQTEGTLFAEFDGYENTGSEGNRIIAVGDGTSSKRVMILDSNTNIRFLISNSGTQADYTSSISAEGNHKVAIAYANNDVAMYIDGVQVSTDSSASIPACPNIYVGTREDGGVTPLAGGIKQALLFKTRLSNAELAALTTI